MAAAAPNAAAALQLLLEFQQVQAQRAEAYSRFSDGFRRFLDSGQERALTALMQQTTPAFAAASKQVIQIESCLRSPAVGRPDLAGLLRQVQELERNKLQLTLSWQALRAAHAAGRFSWQAEADRPRTGGSTGGGEQRTQQQQHLVCLLEQLQVAQQPDASAVSDQQQQVDGCMTVKPGFYQQQLQQAAAAAEAAEAAAASSSSANGHGHGHAGAGGHGHCCGHHHHDHSHEPPDPLDSSGLEPSEAEYNAAVREALQELDGCVTRINETLEEVRDAVLELHEARGQQNDITVMTVNHDC